MEPFTEKEQRFVLAEIIKTSQINVHSLVDFIKSQNVDADWRNMQIPHGRTIHQCESALRDRYPTLLQKRRLSSDHGEYHAAKRVAVPELPDYGGLYRPLQPPGYQALPPLTAPHVPILPRPTGAEYRRPSSPPQPEQRRKRGRPSRADKAKKELQPLLPRPNSLQAPGLSPRLQITAPQATGASPVLRPPELEPAAPPGAKRASMSSILTSPSSTARPMTPPEAYIATTTRTSRSPRTQHTVMSPRQERPRNAPASISPRDLSASEYAYQPNLVPRGG
ncbi:uncharacterized protein F5Z01DRAFT_132953 [Emericellopsis atlantica]|uniref:Uncharacterized protein n=1 Tax=Emericellopsis atlantica TaxID=2614577 RepID=A0A9P8CP67_9HYPO|nr:uncharacterized protein F5Z01DRAFT_132953 [Emericellopsis atlantica]KAG9253872.1 hypothetical protein F5Z01DRAFT_132953 [Emericellopsis atlantica]